ncbi:hypothetical protein QNI24_03220 [Marinicella sp. X102]|nr:hypothetical protein [Marinicella marina]
MIVEGYRSPQQVMNDSELDYEDKLRILEKWNQMLAIKIQVFPDQKNHFNNSRKEVIELVNQLVKEHMHLVDSELLID